jgi:RsmE family RNA methyltransferase
MRVGGQPIVLVLVLLLAMLSVAYALRFISSSIRLRRTTCRNLNRLLLDTTEVDYSDKQNLQAILNPNDQRSKHIKEILKLNDYDRIKCGVLNVGITENSFVTFPSTGQVHIHLGAESLLQPTEKPKVTLILALPRPLRLERLLPIISCLGVDTLALIGAKKVEKDYFGSHILRKPEVLKDLLIEGLAQAAVDCNLPNVIVCKSLRSFLHNDLDKIDSNSSNSLRLIAHPPIPSDGRNVLYCNVQAEDLFALPREGKERIVIALGPEGGWEADEVKQFAKRGFLVTSLGNRILRTDIAVSHFLIHILLHLNISAMLVYNRCK